VRLTAVVAVTAIAAVALATAIEAYLQATNNDPQPFVWTATAEQILDKVRRGRVTLTKVTSQN
jgi:hypothetical protein